ETVPTKSLSDCGRYGVIEFVRRVLRTPGIVLPVYDGLLGCFTTTIRPDEKDRAGVADPRIVGHHVEELDIGESHEHLSSLGQQISGPGEQSYGLELSDRFHPLGVDRRNHVELAGPSLGIMRPGEPGCRMRFPLGRPSVSGLSRS